MIQYFQGYCVSFKLPLEVIPIFKGIELIRKSSCSHPFNELPFFYYERGIAATHSFKFTVFAEQELREGYIININYDTSLVSGMHILKKVCYMTRSFPAIHFFYDSVTFSLERLKRSICQGHCGYFTTLVTPIYYNKRSFIDSRKIEEYVYFRKTIVTLLF